MAGTIIQGVVALATLGAVVAIGFVVSFRTKFAPVQNLIRRTDRRFTNPRMLNKDAGQPGAYASVVNHTGRRSGTHYRTPVVVAAAGDDAYVIALPYGPGVDWVRNVMAAGSATIEHEGRTISVDRPTLIGPDEGNPHFPGKEQRTHRRFGVTDFLLLTSSSTAPDTSD